MGPLLALLFLVVPVLEIYVIIQVGQVIGALPTVLLLIAESLLGAWLVRREGRRTWRALQETLRRPAGVVGALGAPAGGAVGRELTDGALVLIGGTLLLTPGFLTDVVGFFLIVPFTRPVARRLLLRALSRRLVPVRLGPPMRRPGPSRGPWEQTRPPVVPGEVVRDEGSEPPGRAS